MTADWRIDDDTRLSQTHYTIAGAGAAVVGRRSKKSISRCCLLGKSHCPRAAQWGADQELDACCKVLKDWGSCLSPDLRAARRPKPPSLKEQALLAIDTAVADDRLSADVANVVRRALEQLDD